MTYEYLGSDKYKIKLSIFIDCINGQPGAIADDGIANIAIFSGATGGILKNYPIQVGRQGPTRITKVNYNCISTKPNACVDHYWYETTVTLPPATGGYYVSFQRCCRNNSITNLSDPGGTGANYWNFIPDSRTLPDKKPNSSAVFSNLPPNFLCTNTILKFDHSAVDKDGDSLVYDLFWPYRGASRNNPRPDNGSGGALAEPPFPNITFGTGYSDQFPIDGNPPLSIDDETGYLTLIPTKNGQYVVGIRVREYRKGMLISETKRDYQFNVSSCVIDMVAAYFAPKYICGYKHQFKNQSQGAQRYKWDFGTPNHDTSASYEPQFTFPAAGKYRVVLTTYKNNCVDSFVQEVTVLDPTKPKLPQDTTICPSTSVNYTCDVVGDSYKWSTGQTTRGITVGKEGQYWVEVTIKTCSWRDTVKVFEDKDSIKGYGDTIYCTYDTFRRRLFATPGMYKYQWNNGTKLEHTFVVSKGDYVVTAVTLLGCKSSDTVFVEHYPPVEIKLDDIQKCPYETVQLNATFPGANYIWSTGETSNIISVKQPGMYWAKASVGKCYDRDTMILTDYPNEFALGDDLRFCSAIDTILSLDATKFSQFSWNGEVVGSKFRLTKPGKLVVSVVNQYGCKEMDSLYVYLFPNPGLDLGRDTLICLSVKPILDAGAGMKSYLWQDGFKEQKRIVYEGGLYWVEVLDPEGCRSRDSVVIDKQPDVFPSLVYMPNAFTPDGNGINDFFPDNKYVNIGTLYEVKLYNRWGEKLADYHTPDINWDGTIGGKPVPEGVYVYLVTWIGCDDVKRTLRGDFHVLR